MVTDTHSHVSASEVTVYGWNVIVLIDARTKMPLAVKVVPSQAHETLWLRALVVEPKPIWQATPVCIGSKQHNAAASTAATLTSLS